ncbi:MAG TPA: hypothetical protein VME66_01985, partial [Candidatus Acidoferrales bacterium]|nr:hypothetical protein [Candidatus Acidoferrales bacterium]
LEEEELSDQLILEIVERAHERFASRLDALDTVLVGLMAAILAIGAIAIDKYTQLKPCMPFFVSSLACCAIGWALGSVVCRVREPVDPGYVLVGARERGREAVYELAIAIATTYKRRQWLRLAKVAAVAIAMILLFVGIVAALNAESVVK